MAALPAAQADPLRNHTQLQLKLVPDLNLSHAAHALYTTIDLGQSRRRRIKAA